MEPRLFIAFLLATVALLDWANAGEKNEAAVLTATKLEAYVKRFNAADEEIYPQAITNREAFAFLKSNVPLFSCPDKTIERTYYYRWWTYRKHIKQTPDGYIVTEFLPNVPWAAKYNAITCPGTHHFREGRWLHDPKYLRDYATFWVNHSGIHPSKRWKQLRAVLGHGFPLSDALLQFHYVHPSERLITELLPDLTANFEELKEQRKTETGLYWSNDGGWQGDGMEVAIGGPGVRPTFNSYCYAQASALTRFYAMQGDMDRSRSYSEEAEFIASQMMDLLWDADARFFKVMRKEDIPSRKLANARELLGYVPWYYSIPSKGKGYEEAWKQLMDPKGFFAPFGPTTVEQRHQTFRVSYKGHECQWNGPSWPYATSQTLTALANVLHDYPQSYISRVDYFKTLQIYAKSHSFRQIPPGAPESEIVIREEQPWIDENLNPFTGDWLARTRMEVQGFKHQFKERGKAYNHSTFCDLIITGLVGLRPRADNIVEVNPLLPENTWDYFCLDNVLYHGRILTIIWDKTGNRYKKGQGLTLLADGKKIAGSVSLSKITGKLK
jgi:hypothetical protein